MREIIWDLFSTGEKSSRQELVKDSVNWFDETWSDLIMKKLGIYFLLFVFSDLAFCQGFFLVPDCDPVLNTDPLECRVLVGQSIKFVIHGPIVEVSSYDYMWDDGTDTESSLSDTVDHTFLEIGVFNPNALVRTQDQAFVAKSAWTIRVVGSVNEIPTLSNIGYFIFIVALVLCAIYLRKK